ncbi:MAG: geranylgeranyl diphosphate synthase, type [Patescibacteria group bacterium]|nr:geranylgeranyl diphosphate synthase, type [Patescibacteria group bacterium]
MSPTQFKEIFDKQFIKEIEKFIGRTTKISSNKKINEVVAHIKKLGENGKRLRPYILYLGYGEKKLNKDILDQMIAIELLHLFALIHDDIMDNSPTRHGVPTIQNLTKNENLGKSFAMLAGDLVFNWAYEIFIKENDNKKSKEIFSTLIEEVVIGQSMDAELSSAKSWSKEDLDQKTLLKTARYTFRRPLEIGLALRAKKVDKSTEKIYSQIGENLGIIFQIDDDLLDIFGDEKKLNKKTFQDIESKQATLISFYLKNNKIFKSYLGKKLNEEEKENLKNIIKETGTLNKIEEEKNSLITKTEKLIEKTKDKEIWKVFLGKLTNREK